MSPPANDQPSLRRDLAARVAALPAGRRREPRPLREGIGHPIVPVARHDLALGEVDAERLLDGSRIARIDPPGTGEPHHQTAARHLSLCHDGLDRGGPSCRLEAPRARLAPPPAPSSTRRRSRAPRSCASPARAVGRTRCPATRSPAGSARPRGARTSPPSARSTVTPVSSRRTRVTTAPEPELATDVVRDGLDQARAPVRERLPDAQERVVEPVSQERSIGQDAQRGQPRGIPAAHPRGERHEVVGGLPGQTETRAATWPPAHPGRPGRSGRRPTRRGCEPTPRRRSDRTAPTLAGSPPAHPGPNAGVRRRARRASSPEPPDGPRHRIARSPRRGPCAGPTRTTCRRTRP